jgi:hypothetical protein
MVPNSSQEVIGIIVHVLPCHCIHLFHHIIIVWLQELYLFALASPKQSALPISHPTFPPVQWHSAMQLERYQIKMLVGYHWLTCCCCFDEQCVLFCESEMVRVVRAGRFQRSALYSGMDSNISHSNECIICILILCDITTLIVPYSPCSHISNVLFQFECRACQPIIGSVS